MKAGHKKVEGVVTDAKSGLYTVKTTTGTTYTLAETSAVRYGRDVPKVGDEMVLWLDEGNLIMEAHKKKAGDTEPRFLSGKLVSINYGRSQLTVLISGQEQHFKLRPENRMFRNMAVGTPITVAINEVGEVIDLHVDSTSEAPRTGLQHPDNSSALKDFRHLGKPE